MDDKDLKALLGQMAATIQIMADELAELVDQYHRPHLAADRQHVAVSKSQAVLDSAKQSLLVTHTVLGKTDHSANQVQP